MVDIHWHYHFLRQSGEVPYRRSQVSSHVHVVVRGGGGGVRASVRRFLSENRILADVVLKYNRLSVSSSPQKYSEFNELLSVRQRQHVRWRPDRYISQKRNFSPRGIC